MEERSFFVRPEKPTYSKYWEDSTGVSQEEVAKGISFAEAVQQVGDGLD
jgi:inhibitor of KinA sporulation pathway (predicted exonuclease)